MIVERRSALCNCTPPFHPFSPHRCMCSATCLSYLRLGGEAWELNCSRLLPRPLVRPARFGWNWRPRSPTFRHKDSMKRWGGGKTTSTCMAYRCSRARRSEFRCRGGQFIRPNGFHPFSVDGIAFLHRHTGVGVEHLNATSATPREKVEEMVFADGTRAG